MESSSSFFSLKLLSQGGQLLYRGVRAADQISVLLKISALRADSVSDIEKIRHDFKFGQGLKTSAALRPIDLVPFRNSLTLVYEDFDCRPLIDLLQSPMDVETFLRIATLVMKATQAIHQENIIHRGLQPEGILVGKDEVKLIGFGFATYLRRRSQLIQSSQVIEGMMAYMAPEQTGRINRNIDYRSDLYSLGCIFYQMLTGVRPFEADNPLDWVYCHIARSTVPPAGRIIGLPNILSDLVMKLISKGPEERYQSAQGVIEDLDRCSRQWTEKGRIDPFPLGQDDGLSRFEIPQKLFGRERELSALQSGLLRVVSTGVPELVLIQGDAGVGKSSLVKEIYKPVLMKNGLFLTGLTDPHQRASPYFLLVRALEEAIRNILMQGPEKIQQWQTAFTHALGINAQLIINLLPQFELIVGRQTTLSEMPPMQAELHFKRIFQKFVGVLAKKDHPVVLFLDDLQWADPESLEFLQFILTDLNTRYLYVIGAFRTDEVPPSHPLKSMTYVIREAGICSVFDFCLPPLSLEGQTRLLSDTFHITPPKVKSLGELIDSKTAGNPFFINQFLHSLYDDNLINFLPRHGWQWDEEKIISRSYTDNIIDFILKKLTRLSRVPQILLSVAGCFGNEISLEELQRTLGETKEWVISGVIEAVQLGFIQELGGVDKIRFTHDRVRKACYDLLSEDKRSEIHFNIYKMLTTYVAIEMHENRLFEMANQLFLGISQVKDSSEKVTAAGLLLKAGLKAKASSVYKTGIKFLKAGISLLEADSWDTQYSLSYDLHIECARCELLCGHLNETESLMTILSQRGDTLVERFAIQEIRIQIHTRRGNIDQSIAIGLETLKSIGVNFPLHPTDQEVRQILNRTWEHLKNYPIENLGKIPPIKDVQVQAAQSIAIAFGDVTYFTNFPLCTLLNCYIVDTTLTYGVSESSVFGLGAFSFLIQFWRGGYIEAKQVATHAYELMEQRGFNSQKGRMLNILGSAVGFWTTPYAKCVVSVEGGLHAMIEVGDYLHASYTSLGVVLLLFEAGTPLGEICDRADYYIEFVNKFNFVSFKSIPITKYWIQILSGNRPLRPKTEDLISAGDSALAKCWDSIFELITCVVMGDFDQAVTVGKKLGLHLSVFSASSYLPDYYYYYSLAMALHFERASPETQKQYLENLLDYEQKFREWAVLCPENFAAKQAHLSAELARIKKQDLEAQHLYEKAILKSRLGGLVHVEALIRETASQFYRTNGLTEIADTYLRGARTLYLRWGAYGKVKKLELANEFLVEIVEGLGTWKNEGTQSHLMGISNKAIDLISVTRASQAISGEIVLDKLIHRLIQVTMEQSGARRGYLLVINNNARIEAIGQHIDQRIEISVFRNKCEEACFFAKSIVQYVESTQEKVVLDDASSILGRGRFHSDKYLDLKRPKSILCLPIVRQVKAIAVLYLENELVPGTFTSERLMALEILASQAAISLENAFLVLREAELRAMAEEAVQMREDFICIAAHEFRTPLTSQKMQLQLLKSMLTKEVAQSLPKYQPLLQLIMSSDQQLERLSRLVEDLLDSSRMQSGQVILRPGPLDLSDLVREVAERYRSNIEKSHGFMELKTEKGIVGHWDRVRIDQVVTNLLSNATKYGAGKPIYVETAFDNNYAKIVVEDHGIGIPAEYHSKIFDRFQRAVSVDSFGGFGLGLYISKKIVEAHGGKISFKSKVGEGSKFITELPFHLDSPRSSPYPNIGQEK